MIWGRASYRVRQLQHHLRARVEPEERIIVAQRLSSPLQRLFLNMPRESQRHCLNVYYALAERGCQDEELLQAALLHDVGKQGVKLRHRVARVLLGATAPGLLRRWAAEGPGPLRRGLHRLLNHAEAGATLAHEAGASMGVAELILHHEGANSDDPRLRLLQEADGAL